MSRIMNRFKTLVTVLSSQKSITQQPRVEPPQQEHQQQQQQQQQQDYPSLTLEVDPLKPMYRGFSSSISHQYVSKSSERTDTCSLVCCGILQSDRDRYIITGIPPPSCIRRILLHFSYHIVLPVFLFTCACVAATNISDSYYNQLVSTVLVALMCVFLVMQCCKGRWKRSGIRQELLWRSYGFRTGKTPDDNDDEAVYMQGQSNMDIMCVHAFMGCYRQDKPKELPDVAPRDLMGCLWRFYTQLCCGKLCGCYLQICGMCGIAQEARELEAIMERDGRRIDYITMQSWAMYYPTILRKRMAREICFTLSQLSIHLLQAWLVFFIVMIALTTYLKFSYGHVLVCFGAFLHAFVFMGFVHWIWYRHDVSFDLIVKAFSCGFFLSTTLAICWETVIGVALRILMDVMLAMTGVQVSVITDGYSQFNSFRLPGGFAMASATRRDYLDVFSQDHPFLYALYLLLAAYGLAALIEELVRYLGFRMVSDHPDFWDRSELEGAIWLSQEELQNRRNTQQKHDALSILQDIPTEIQDRPRTVRGAMITVTMVAVALGFACCENLLYIFLYNDHSVTMETSVLIARMIFPVHPICAAIQSIGIVKRDVEKSRNSELGRALFPAIVLHGTFDYILMVADFINTNKGTESGPASIIFAFGIVVVGVYYYFTESAKQRRRLARADRQSTVDQSSLL